MPLRDDHRGGNPDDEQVIGVGEEPHARGEQDLLVFPAGRRLIHLSEQPAADLRVLSRVRGPADLIEHRSLLDPGHDQVTASAVGMPGRSSGHT
jgi:hypothetical protein